MRKRVLGALVAVCIGLLGLLALAGRVPEVTVRLLDLPSTAAQVLPFQAGDLEGAVLLSHVEYEGPGPDLQATWLEALDLKTGARISRRTVRGLATCYGALKDRLWCWTPQLGLHHRTLPGLEVVESQLELTNRLPALAGLLRPDAMDFGIDRTGQVVLATNDGRSITLDGRGENLTFAPARPLIEHPARTALVLGARFPAEVSLVGGERQRLSWNGRLSAEDYLAPRFVEDRLAREGLAFAQPPGVLLAHVSRYSAANHPVGLTLSRVEAGGATAWSFLPGGPLGPGDRPEEHVLGAWAASRGFFLAVRAGHRATLVMLDPASGTPVWSTTFDRSDR